MRTRARTHPVVQLLERRQEHIFGEQAVKHVGEQAAHVVGTIAVGTAVAIAAAIANEAAQQLVCQTVSCVVAHLRAGERE